VSNRRILILILAVALAGVAAFATYTYLSSADKRAKGDTQLQQVLVLGGDVAKGTKGVEVVKKEQGIVTREIPDNAVPANAITDVNSISQLVAITDFKQGAILQQGMFVDPTVAQTSFADRLEAEKGKHAISISVDQIHGVGGFVTPGDYVNLIVEVKPVSVGQEDTTVATPALNPDGSTTNQETGEHTRTVYLLQKVKVLAVGSSVIPQAGEAVPDASAVVATNTGLITFAVTPEEALKISRAQDNGTIYLSLVPDDYQVTPVVPIGEENLLDKQYVAF
jgi:pilus assembly protein CpaB